MPVSKEDYSVYDPWMKEGAQAPVAVVRREKLRPVAGEGAVIFPPTFAGQGDAGSIYAFDDLPDGRSVLMDTVGSQANRMEALFMPPDGPLQGLIPQIEFSVPRTDGTPSVTLNLLEAGHRAADALVRFSDLAPKVGEAFRAIDSKRNYVPMAQLSPLSLVFGVWDSRGFSGVRIKIPRMITSTVRAYNVTLLKRNAQFVPAVRRKLEKDEIEKLSGVDKDTRLSEEGLAEAPATGWGGVVSRGPIIRESILSLVALRNIYGPDAESTTRLRRYILSLGLACLGTPLSPEYRSGTILVPADSKNSTTLEVVSRDGGVSPISLGDVTQLACSAAEDFGISKETAKQNFEWKKVKETLKAKKEKKETKSTEE